MANIVGIGANVCDTLLTVPNFPKEDTKINFKTMTAIQIKNLIRGLNPIMGAYAYLNNKKIKIWKVEVIEEKAYEKQTNIKISENYENGTVMLSNSKEGLYIKAK